jgi:hypothetical protein
VKLKCNAKVKKMIKTITSQEYNKKYKQLIKKSNKYFNKPTYCKQNHLHPSKLEAGYCDQYHLMQKEGIIHDLIVQPEFILQEGYYDKKGKWIKPIIYRAEHKFQAKDGIHVIEVKGMGKNGKVRMTKDAALKIKMFRAKFKEYIFEIKS